MKSKEQERNKLDVCLQELNERVRKGKTLDYHQELRRWIDIIKDVLMWLQLCYKKKKKKNVATTMAAKIPYTRVHNNIYKILDCWKP